MATLRENSEFYRRVYPQEVTHEEILQRNKEGFSIESTACLIVSVEGEKKKEALHRVGMSLLTQARETATKQNENKKSASNE